MGTGLIITFALIAAYVLLLFWLARTDRMEKYNLSLMLGFILMIRTQRGQGAIEAISRPKRLWNAFGDLGTGVVLTGMALMTAFFLWTVTIVLRPDSGVRPLAANEVLVIPGVNPFVPLWYGIIALIVTLVVHEGGHGVLARANNLRVKSLGLLVAVIPIGAFVEPDESELMGTTRRKRLRVFSAGPMVNIVVALLLLFAFAGLMGAATPVSGVAVSSVVEDSPALAAGMMPGTILVSVDGRPLEDIDGFTAYMDERRPGESATFTNAEGGTHNVTFVSAWSRLTPEQQATLLEENRTRAQEAEQNATLGVNMFDGEDMQEVLSQPFGSSRMDNGGTLVHFLLLVSLPIGEVQDAPYLSFYLPTFYETPFNEDVFFITLNLAYWIFWINLMVGLTNILPMLPLDGGHIFRDAIGGTLARLRPAMDPQKREKLVGSTAVAVSLTILVAFLLQIFGPRFL